MKPAPATESRRLSRLLLLLSDGEQLTKRFHSKLANGILNAMKTEMIQIDKAGRVVLPKPLREHFHLLPGDKLRLSVEGKSMRLEPTDVAGTLVRKGSVLVFRGDFSEALTAAKIGEVLGETREERFPEPTPTKRKK